MPDIAKIILNGVTQMDVTQDTVDSGKLLYGETATKNDGSSVTGTIASKTSSDLTASGATVTAPAGYYASAATKSVASGTEGTPTATKGTVSSYSITVTPSVTNAAGYIAGGIHTGTGVSVSASELVSGTKTISENGTAIDVTNYAAVDVAVPSEEPVLQAKTNITPTTSSQTITADSGYDGLSSVQINAMPSGTAGTPVATKGTVSDYSVSVTPSVTNTAGYISGGTETGTAISVSASELVSGTYSVTSSGIIDVTNYASASVPSGTEGTPTATKGTVSSNSITVTPSVTNGTGFITGGTHTGTGVSVSASELVSGTKTISANGTGIDVTNYAEVDVAVQPTLQSKSNIAPSTTSQTIQADVGYDGLSSVQINAMPSGTAGTPVATKGTVSNHSVSVTPSVTNTTGYITGGTETGTAATVTAAELVSGTKSITTNGTGIDVTNYADIDVAVIPSLQSKTGVVPSETSQTIEPDVGYDGLDSVQIDPISSTYIGSEVVQKAAATYMPTTTNQTIAADQYLTGAQTIVGDADLVAENIKSGVDIFGVEGAFTSDADAVAGDILSGKSAYVNGSLVTGNIATKTSANMTVSGKTVTAPAGYYASNQSKSVADGSATAPASISGSSATVSTGTNTLTLTKTISVTPSVTAGYVASGTAGNSEVSLTASVTTKAAATITPGTSNQTIAAGTYLTGAQTISGNSNLIAANIKKGVAIFGVTGTYTTVSTNAAAAGSILKDKIAFVNGSQITGTIVTKSASDLTASGATVTVPAGYYASQVTKSIGTGTAKAPTSISGTSATVSTGTNTLTLTKSISVTPVVTAGYISAGTATTSSVSLTASVTTKAAATITPGTSNQTIAAGTYLTGVQTIAGNANLVAANIKKGVSIFGVTGTYAGDSGLQSKVIHTINSTLTAISSATTTVTFDTPLTFAEYTGGIYLNFWIDGLERSAGSNSSTYTLRVIAKNSSNATVNINVGTMSYRYNQGSDPLVDAMIMVKSNGSGICIFPHGTSGINYMSTTNAFTSSAITQITGFSTISSVAAASVTTRGAVVTIYGVK